MESKLDELDKELEQTGQEVCEIHELAHRLLADLSAIADKADRYKTAYGWKKENV